MTDWIPDRTRQRLADEREAKATAQSTDLPIFAPHNGTETSRAAAERVTPHMGTQRHRILAAISEAKGVTRGELVASAGIRENAVNPRCAELLTGELIEERGVREGRAVLWLTAKGWAVLTETERLARMNAA